MKIFSIFILVMVMANPVFASEKHSAEDGKFYVSGGIGLGSLTDYEHNGVELDFDTGIGFIGAVGYDTGPFRIEGEITYRGYTVDNVLVEPARTPPEDGDILDTDSSDASFSTFMVNGYYDMEIPRSNWTTSVGFGLGFVKAEIESTSWFVHTETDDPATPEIEETVSTITAKRSEVFDKSTEVAYQAMLGLDYEVFEGLNWTGGYRFLGHTNNNGVFAHEFNVGLRVTF